MTMHRWSRALAVAGICGLAATGLTTIAHGAEEGPYLEGRIGASLPMDSDADVGATSGEIEFDAGPVGNLAIGHGFGNGFRTEFELGYRMNDVESGNADSSIWSGMANILYDFDLNSPLQPYIGAGAGITRVNGEFTAPGFGTVIDDSDTTFGWQAMAGVAYAVSDRSKVTLTYRYFSVPDVELDTAAGTPMDTEYASHDIMVGFRYSFGAPKKPMAEPAPPPAPVAAQAPPPPAPAPAPPPPRNFLVFFDFDSSAITSQAQGIIESAASAARSLTPVKIRLTGHADRAGPTGYNQRLSLRRAEAVRAALERLNIASDDIAVLARGESEPLVQTADGVREPQNRRVQIVLE